MKPALLAPFALGAWLTACVVTTHGGTGTSPAVPAEPEDMTPTLAPAGPVQVGASHYLISYKGALRAAPYVERSKDEARQLAADLRQRVLDGEDFSKLAAQFSDDRGSAANGGKLGLFRREQMVPEFSNAAFALEVGQISHVIESPYGFHVILRTE